VVNYKYISQRSDVFPINIMPTLTREISEEEYRDCAILCTIICDILLQLQLEGKGHSAKIRLYHLIIFSFFFESNFGT